MYYFDFENNIDVRSGHLWITHNEGAISSRSPSVIIMQYIGLKDESGRKIYEKDVVRCWGGIYHKGFWEYDCKIVIDSINEPDTLMTLLESEYIKVVGNVYENPELIA